MVTFLVLLLPGLGKSQEFNFDPSDPEFSKRYDTLEMNGAFCVSVAVSGATRYYLADFTRLPDRFKKIWFINLVHADSKVVSADVHIEHSRVWFQSSVTIPSKEVIDRMNELLNSTLATAAGMTPVEQENYLKKNDKYNKSR